jgi:hypothetical protein
MTTFGISYSEAQEMPQGKIDSLLRIHNIVKRVEAKRGG